MFQIFRALAERVKALFVTDAALDFEAEFLCRDAERKAELLRQATRYDEEGLHGIAGHIRQQAELLSLERPLASVLPSVTHLQVGAKGTTDLSALPALANESLAPSGPKALHGPKKKGAKK